MSSFLLQIFSFLIKAKEVASHEKDSEAMEKEEERIGVVATQRIELFLPTWGDGNL